MARQLYSTEFVQLAGTANPAPGLPFRVWTDLTAGSDVTSQIVGPDGSSAYTAQTDPQGNIAPFRGPDGYLGNLFVDTGASYRFMLDSPTLLDYLVQQVLTLLAGGGGGGVTDHGALSGLLDDDHPQYHNDARGDARYYLKSLVDSAIAAAIASSSTADRNRANHSGTQLASSISDFAAAVVAAGGGGGGGGVTDHGALSGLLDDDHPQYLTNLRGDARYYSQAQVDAKTTAAASQNSTADRDRANHTGVQSIGSVTNLQTTLDAKRSSFDASMAGNLAVVVGGLRKRLPAACTLDSITVAVGTAPAGSAVIVDVKQNGTTIFGTAANRPTIAAGTNGVTVAATAASVTTFAAGDYLTVDVAQVGSTTPGADLVASVWVRF